MRAIPRRSITHTPPNTKVERRTYDPIRKKLFWSHMESDTYLAVSNCPTCALNRKRVKEKRLLKLFSPCGRFDYTSMDILGLLLQKVNGSVLVNVLTDQCYKIKRAICTSVTIATHAVSAFLNSQNCLYDIQDDVLTANSPQIVKNVFEKLFRLLGLKSLTITTYHGATNGRAQS